MSGHNKWSKIKHKKGASDQKRGNVFSKLLNAISVAAKTERNPEFSPRLRTAIQKAKENNVPSDKIERAIKRASEAGQNLEELIFEAYGHGGTAILIEAISDNKNRTIAEVKKIINERGGKWAEAGSVQWAFEKSVDDWTSKFPQELGAEDKNGLKLLVDALESHDDVQKVHTNSS